MTETHPKFAVVGHPNKGKSSIVSTLALDDSVAISSVPGTTARQRAFPLRIDGQTLYELIDTPGFQRPRAVLAWLEKEDVPAHRKADRVRRFIHEHRDDPRFHDEIELLTPVMEGAGILYVIDGSKPYGPEYEAEMEILRWTGRPSMALINLIGETDHVQEWKQALGHYFRMVRVFNPMRAGFPQMTALLESMAQLREEWTAPVKRAIGIFEAYQRRKIDDSAAQIAELELSVLGHVETMPIRGGRASEQERKKAEERYRGALRRKEEQAFRKIAETWNHLRIEGEAPPLFDSLDLFSKESTSLFGLRKKELIVTGVAGGALAGSGVDLALGGGSLMLGSALGAVAGGAGAALGFGKLAQVKVLGQAIGRRRLQVGPVRDRNFPFVLLRRALYYTQEVANRPHADRRKIVLEDAELLGGEWLDGGTKRRLDALHRKMASDAAVKEETVRRYRDLVRTILLGHIPH